MAVTIALVVIATFATATVSSVAGFGGAVLLLPVFIAVFGTRDAVAVLTVAQLASNSSRVWFNRTEVDRGPVARLPGGRCRRRRWEPSCSRPRRCRA